MIKIIPVKNRKPIDPETNKPVPEGGVLVRKLTTYWRNRKRDGDITIQEVKKPKSEKPKEGAK